MSQETTDAASSFGRQPGHRSLLYSRGHWLVSDGGVPCRANPRPKPHSWAHAEKVQADYLSLRLSEADTRSYLIDPVLRLLGYEGVKHLRREMPVPATKEAIDYELLVDGKAHAIVEAKAIRHQIAAQDAAQAVQYASILGVRWCLITNGLHWALYDAHANIPLAEKRVAEVRLDGDPTAVAHAWTVLSLFSREAVASTSPLTSLLIERVLADELQGRRRAAPGCNAPLRRAGCRRRRRRRDPALAAAWLSASSIPSHGRGKQRRGDCATPQPAKTPAAGPPAWGGRHEDKVGRPD